MIGVDCSMYLFNSKALKDKIKRFESGEEYIRQNKKIEQITIRSVRFETLNNKLNEKNKKLTIQNENLKFEVKQIKSEITDLKNKFDDLYKYIAKAEEKIAEDREIIKELKIENKALKVEIEETKNLNKKLIAQINKDYTNSSLPSSQKIGRKKICNSRIKSGKKPGGQAGHKGHSRKSYSTPDRIIEVPRPEKYKDENIFIETGEIIKKQVVDIAIGFEVTEYRFMEYKNILTGEIVHMPIPEELNNETSYGPNVKALAVLLNSHANVSIDKTIEVISEISGQNINLSKGFVNNLNEKIVKKSENELDEIFINLQEAKYMHIDATNVRVNGKNANVFVTTNPNDTLYYARENKGKKGVENTVAEDYCQILIHDHDRTFYNYGSGHQECLAHILRYLQSTIENEPKLTWHSKMKLLLQEIISAIKKESLDISSKNKYIIEYDAILELSNKEYKENPPTKYFKDGFNLAKRLKKYKDSTLYFLEDEEIPYTNNLAERQLRKIKRKAHVAGSFRSFEGLDNYCKVQSVIDMAKNAGDSIFKHLSNIFPQINFD